MRQKAEIKGKNGAMMIEKTVASMVNLTKEVAAIFGPVKEVVVREGMTLPKREGIKANQQGTTNRNLRREGVDEMIRMKMIAEESMAANRNGTDETEIVIMTIIEAEEVGNMIVLSRIVRKNVIAVIVMTIAGVTMVNRNGIARKKTGMMQVGTRRETPISRILVTSLILVHSLNPMRRSMLVGLREPASTWEIS
jgi:hypothetical protein